MKKNELHFVVCVNDTGRRVSLEKGKIYPLLGIEKAGRNKLIRVMDESGEDYLYPSNLFMSIDLPKPVEKALQLAV